MTLSLMFQGGIRGVVWADVFQAVVLLTGLLAVVVQVSEFYNCFGSFSHFDG